MKIILYLQFELFVKKRSVLTIANINIPLFFGEIKKPYIAKQTVKNYSFLGTQLPIKKTTAYFKKIYIKNITLDKSTAKQLAENKMQKLSKKQLKNTIKSVESEKFQTKSNGVFYEKVFICEENIAKQKEILK